MIRIDVPNERRLGPLARQRLQEYLRAHELRDVFELRVTPDLIEADVFLRNAEGNLYFDPNERTRAARETKRVKPQMPLPTCVRKAVA